MTSSEEITNWEQATRESQSCRQYENDETLVENGVRNLLCKVSKNLLKAYNKEKVSALIPYGNN